MSLLEAKKERNYIYVLGSDGTLRKSVPEGTEDSVKREYEDSKGNKGAKYELVFSKLEGKITDISFWEGDYGRNLQIEVENAGESVVLSLGIETSFGKDVMKKLPNVDLEKEVSFEPFSFENDKGKLVKGISIRQSGEKIQNYYFDSEKKVSLHGLPEIEGKAENFDKDDWKIHFLKIRKFLAEETEKLIAAKFGEKKIEKAMSESFKGYEEDVDPKKIPW